MKSAPAAPRPADRFAEHCAELLAPLGPVRVRRMFGGHGIYLQELMVALVAREQLFMKTDEITDAAWRAAGGAWFTFAHATRGEVTTHYCAPPEEALESTAAMQPWARLALEAALRAANRKPAARKATPKR
ncbi:MAG TPA: TfoX/Sxy family protein [Burkholderiaceae bacterium]|jgi:DNA transformation protein|nr:TfoX/Sxy family protein [Burkholderiaceae bacterium]